VIRKPDTALSLATRRKMNRQERIHQKEWCGSFKPRSDAEAEWDKEEC